MRLSENRVVAWSVLALAVLLSVLLSGGSAMRDMRNATQQTYYEGAMQNGVRTGLSISRDLGVRVEKAYVISSLGKQYLPNDERVAALEQAAKALADAQQPTDAYRANAELTRTVEDLYTALSGMSSLSKQDADALYGAYKEMQSRADTISRDTYNTEAHVFNASIAKFPANIISGLVQVTPLQTFD